MKLLDNEALKICTRFLDELIDPALPLSEEQSANLQFLQAFGVADFIRSADDSVIAEKTIYEFANSVLDGFTISMTELTGNCSLGGYSRFDSKHKRAKRRWESLKKRSRIVALGSDNIFAEDGSLIRPAGVLYQKAKKAEDSLASDKLFDNHNNHSSFYDRLSSFQKKQLLKVLCNLFGLEKRPKSHKILSISEREICKRSIRRSKRYMRLARKYEDYTILYKGRYFRDGHPYSAVMFGESVEITSTWEEAKPDIYRRPHLPVYFPDQKITKHEANQAMMHEYHFPYLRRLSVLVLPLVNSFHPTPVQFHFF